MQCPDCGWRARGNFCSHCGRQLPYVVGENFTIGLRFPRPQRPGVSYQSAVNAAKCAPKYSEREFRGTIYHHALFELQSVRDLARLDVMAQRVFPKDLGAVEHTVDGRRFIPGPLPWWCLADRMEKRIPGGLVVPHEGVKCFSFWGCMFAQDRQPRYLHVDGLEMFAHGVHGRFMCSQGDEDVFGSYWPAGFLDRLRKTPFHFDRRTIRDGVMRMIRKEGGNRCPIFSGRYLDAQLEKIPKTVTPDESPQWEVVELPGFWAGVALKCYEPKPVLNTTCGAMPAPRELT